MSLARAVAAANKRARDLGVDIHHSLVTIIQCAADAGSLWRINYGPVDYVDRRGGDLVIEVDEHAGTIKNVRWGQ